MEVPCTASVPLCILAKSKAVRQRPLPSPLLFSLSFPYSCLLCALHFSFFESLSFASVHSPLPTHAHSLSFPPIFPQLPSARSRCGNSMLQKERQKRSLIAKVNDPLFSMGSMAVFSILSSLGASDPQDAAHLWGRIGLALDYFQC